MVDHCALTGESPTAACALHVRRGFSEDVAWCHGRVRGGRPSRPRCGGADGRVRAVRPTALRRGQRPGPWPRPWRATVVPSLGRRRRPPLRCTSVSASARTTPRATDATAGDNRRALAGETLTSECALHDRRDSGHHRGPGKFLLYSLCALFLPRQQRHLLHLICPLLLKSFHPQSKFQNSLSKIHRRHAGLRRASLAPALPLAAPGKQPTGSRTAVTCSCPPGRAQTSQLPLPRTGSPVLPCPPPAPPSAHPSMRPGGRAVSGPHLGEIRRGGRRFGGGTAGGLGGRAVGNLSLDPVWRTSTGGASFGVAPAGAAAVDVSRC